ncbi:uncharacterized protein BDZ99DRAFT_28134 [Mytilinidion resinicola]|uniref:Zn(2)-C6 fungal-type domain-containing protein n=1 Tax=Mytilinidion resinicola TaxID=574789 RepID=A0A6A6YLF3_9PEZI|nr:uncharacterized protein BDZ99DRAFT_28134 [Mytilinidion resinicola]KAF2809393.1 hypothetical protein BDZ99DRAFT_28134 [Mytilinidion resinicola]
MPSSLNTSIERQLGRPAPGVASTSIMPLEFRLSDIGAMKDPALEISSVGFGLDLAYQTPRDPFQTPERRTTATVTLRKRPGGRKLGGHLRPEVAKDAHRMRKIGACWRCVIQRDRCDSSNICERCLKRSHPSLVDNMHTRLECNRGSLYDLAPQFLPAVLRRPYQESEIQKSWTDRIESWRSERKYVLTLSWRITPPLVEENVQEGVLIKTPLPGTEYLKKTVREIALGLDLSNGSNGSKYAQYISSVIYTGIGDVPFALYPGTSECNVLYRELITQVFGYYECTGNETLAEMAKLLIMTHCFTHSPSLLRSIPNLQALSRNTPLPMSDNLGLELLYHQLKSHLALIQSTQLDLLLERCDKALRTPKTAHLSQGLPLILTFIGLAMNLEQIQVALHRLLVGHRGDQAEQEDSCRRIEQGIDMIIGICRLKYGAQPKTHFQHRNAVDGDSAETTFALNLDGLISRHVEFLSRSAEIKLPVVDPSLYPGRLTSKFLLWFGEIARLPLQSPTVECDAGVK